jgi:hypothetical protein
MLTYDEIMERNIELSFEFSLYVMEHPDFAASIPKGAKVTLLPKDDPELSRINRETAESHRDAEPGIPLVFVEFERLESARSRLVRPRIAALQPT